MGEPQIVQVRIPGARRSYAYTWDGEPLEVGQWVELPGNDVSPEGTEGRVEGFGADGYKGPMKAVAGVKDKQDPWMARMRQVKTPADRLQVYRRAQKAGISGERLSKLVELGKQVLDKQTRDQHTAFMVAAVRASGGDGQDMFTSAPAVDPAVEERRHAGSLGRVDAGASQENTRDWGEWE